MFDKVERKKIKKLYDSFVKDRLEYGDFFDKIKVGTKMKELRGHHAGQNFVVKKIRPSGGRLNFMIEYDDGQEYSAYSDDLWDDYKANKLVFADSIKTKDAETEVFFEEIDRNTAQRYARRFKVKLKEMKNWLGQPMFRFYSNDEKAVLDLMGAIMDEEGIDPSDP